MLTFKLTYTTMGVELFLPNKIAEIAVKNFAESLHAPKMARSRGKVFMEQGDGYYLHIPDDHTFIFHKLYAAQLKEVVNAALRFMPLQYQWEESTAEHKEPYRCEYKRYGFEMVVTDPESRFFYQNEVVEKAMEPDRLQVIYALQTGSGKTKSAQKVTVSRGVRTAIIVRPTYIDKWYSDTVKDKTGLREKSKHVEIVKGIQGIVELIDEGKSGRLDKRKISTIIIPTVSLLLFLKAYQAEPTDFPGIRLADFYNYLGVGQVIYDEVHEHFYTVYMSGIALNPPATVEMSATLEPGVSKQFIRDRYEERFPRDLRISIPYRPVVDVRALYYKVPDHKFATKINRMKMYNHKVFEQLLHKEGKITAYFDMVWDILERSFLNGHQKGQRALVFFSLVDSCKDFRTYLDYRLMKKGLNLTTSKYNAGDSYDEFMKSDIGVSTPGKAGTAVDIPGLTTAIVTIPIDDRQLNEQITGRPRALTQWDMTPKVFFLHGLQLDKHNSYLASRRKSLEKIVKSFLVGHSNYII